MKSPVLWCWLCISWWHHFCVYRVAVAIGWQVLWRLMAEQSPAEEGLLGLEEGRMSNEIVTYTTMGRNNNTSLHAITPKLCKVSLIIIMQFSTWLLTIQGLPTILKGGSQDDCSGWPNCNSSSTYCARVCHIWTQARDSNGQQGWGDVAWFGSCAGLQSDYVVS